MSAPGWFFGEGEGRNMKTLCNIVGCDEVPLHWRVRIQYGNVRIVLRSLGGRKYQDISYDS